FLLPGSTALTTASSCSGSVGIELFALRFSSARAAQPVIHVVIGFLTAVLVNLIVGLVKGNLERHRSGPRPRIRHGHPVIDLVGTDACEALGDLVGFGIGASPNHARAAK